MWSMVCSYDYGLQCTTNLCIVDCGTIVSRQRELLMIDTDSL